MCLYDIILNVVTFKAVCIKFPVSVILLGILRLLSAFEKTYRLIYPVTVVIHYFCCGHLVVFCFLGCRPAPCGVSVTEESRTLAAQKNLLQSHLSLQEQS